MEAARLAATNSGRESYCRDGGQDFEIPPGFSFGGAGAFLFSKEKTSRAFPAESPQRNSGSIVSVNLHILVGHIAAPAGATALTLAHGNVDLHIVLGEVG